MSHNFQPQYGLVYVDAVIEGPTKRVRGRLALDTASTGTVIDLSQLVAAGYDPNQASRHTTATTASGTVFAPIMRITRLEALGQERLNFDVITHVLPLTASSEGLLGLDFLRGLNLQLNFRTGTIDLS